MPFVRSGDRLPTDFSRVRVPVASRVRSSFLLSSRAMLREIGVYDRYVTLLTPEDRQALDAVVPGWMPVSLIRRHYQACDALSLAQEQMLYLGKCLYRRMHEPVFGIAVRLAGELGVTPWTLAEQAVRMWHRAFDGGDILVEQLGPKEARFELLGFPYVDIPYCRVAWRGILLGGTELFSRRAYVNESERRGGPNTIVYRLSWA
ncbi:MAG TPA: hypothetical protein VGI39_07480 [Polyangiaceae bacterium]